METIDNLFVNRISIRLDKFKRISSEKFNFRCPLCGDSRKSKIKTRGWLFVKNNHVFYRCFNCSASMSFSNFLKVFSPIDYEDYIVEQYKERNGNKPKEVDDSFFNSSSNEIVIPKSNSILSKLIPVKQSEFALQYCKERKIPDDKLDLLYFTDDFHEFANSVIPGKFEKMYKHSRLVIPCFNKDKEIVQITGRVFKNEIPRYIHLSLADEEKVYGIERLDYSKPIIAVEGQIDSLFLNNAVAMSGSNFKSDFLLRNKSNVIICYDNEPRNLVIMQLMQRTIDAGYRVCIWSNSNPYKDINDMILNGLNPEQYILNNNYSGIEALLKFGEYKKC